MESKARGALPVPASVTVATRSETRFNMDQIYEADMPVRAKSFSFAKHPRNIAEAPEFA
jgi:hypothetical protein